VPPGAPAIAATPVPPSAPAISRFARTARRAPASPPPQPGTLRIFSEPWAELSVDGKATGESTPIGELRLPPGAHRLRLTNPVLNVQREVDVTVREGETRVLQISLGEGPAAP
jgi:hypothetical protein